MSSGEEPADTDTECPKFPSRLHLVKQSEVFRAREQLSLSSGDLGLLWGGAGPQGQAVGASRWSWQPVPAQPCIPRAPGVL